MKISFSIVPVCCLLPDLTQPYKQCFLSCLFCHPDGSSSVLVQAQGPPDDIVEDIVDGEEEEEDADATIETDDGETGQADAVIADDERVKEC